MLVKILKPFPYSEDGINIRNLVAGAVEAIHDELVPGLKGEGYVGDAEGAVAADLEAPAVDAAPGPAEDQSTTAEPDEDQAPVVEPVNDDADSRTKIITDLTDLKADFHPKAPRAKLLAQRNELRALRDAAASET